MARNGSGKRRQAPAYSADAMAVRYMAGLVLIALGVLIFMAVELRLSGNIFEGLRRICFGLCGILAYVLPVLPAWAGGLVIWSTQRRAPVRPWLFALLAFFGICTLMMVTGGLEWQDRQVGGDFGAVVNNVYADSAARMERASGGGAAGAILAWPLWKFLGPVLGTMIVFALTLLCILLTANMTPSRLKDLFTGQYGARRERERREREQAEQQQMAYLQQQAYAAQQQAQIIQQQQQQAYMNQPNMQPPYPQPDPAWQAQAASWPNPADNSVREWQEQTATSQLAATSAGRQSQIFNRKKEEKPVRGDKSFVSRLFGRKQEEYDGLSDGPAPAANTGRREEGSAGRTNRRTVTGEPITGPDTHWTPAVQPEEPPVRNPESRIQARQTAMELPTEKPKPAETPATPAAPVQEKPVRDDSSYRRPAKEKTEVPAEKPPEEPKPQVPVPVVQSIGEKAYKPKLNVPARTGEEEPEDEGPWMPTPYNYPPITDLAKPQQGAADTREEDAMRSRKLEETLASFRVQARVVHVTHGPAISRFELELEAGTKVNKVAELEKDIAYGMSATSVRIEAPIPGKSLVGVEVPNRKVTTVTLREVMESEQMQSARSILTVALGKDIAGTPIVCDLAKMPHMLIAGQTGSGKSVCINAIINSLLYRASPDEVRLILVDPKVVELQCYNGIPHLLIPVVNDPRKAAAALAWAVAEMMERYDKFAERKVRNLEGYNQWAEKNGEKPMARLVIIIDELADLMMVCKKDVEEYICRLTQLARAAGIHLIVATQRPSVDVITGLIKANIPSRIAFKTASSVDSRTILDRIGAEQLLGWGDMLYSPTGSFAPTRVQGCFLSDEEVNRIAAHVRQANPSTYDPDILEKLDELANGGEGGGADIIINSSDMSGGDGGLFEQAVEFAIQDGQISTSTLQRRLKIGYARAGRLTDEMEERGIVAAKDGSKPRKCLITREEWEAMKQSTEGMV